MALVLGIDPSTQSTKARLVDSDSGEVVATRTAPHPPQHGGGPTRVADGGRASDRLASPACPGRRRGRSAARKSPSRTGGRMPMRCTAIGKVLLAHSEPALVQEVLSGPLERRTLHTIVAPGLLRRQLLGVLENGVAFEREESTVGLTCVAAPVTVSGAPVSLAISVTGPVGRFRPDAYVAAVRAAGAGLGSVLSRHASPP
ncbi:IclR family transcriptional regulator domain-containing protein [Nocardioides daphniae]|uniref:IclR-ED domain-containing protein n=1 Tax=Nocardioides daphniae TaxID=402297 RepID=A0A4P7UE21_9ACTN|nr:IclR family transcriptional regulator C-terminal domain-containing protein [Nocardioides daphniae]QCC77189.1 hypothetical protein E2C04_08175 [Nocardioides daphniae]